MKEPDFLPSRTVCNCGFTRAYRFPNLVAESVTTGKGCMFVFTPKIYVFILQDWELFHSSLGCYIWSYWSSQPTLQPLEILLLLSPPAVKEGWESILKSFPHPLQVVKRKDHFSLLGLPHPKFHLQRCRHLIPCPSSKSLRMNRGLFIEALLHIPICLRLYKASLMHIVIHLNSVLAILSLTLKIWKKDSHWLLMSIFYLKIP